MEKRYFLIRPESDPKVIGVRNGVTQVEIQKSQFADYDKLIDFFDTFKYWQKKTFTPDFNFTIEHVKILDNAILTDFLTFNPSLMACPFMISNKVKTILEDFLIQEHYFFSVKIFNGMKLIDDSYHLLYCPYLDFEIIDFKKSIFYTGNKITGKKMVQLNSKEEYISYLQDNPLLQREKIILSDKFNCKLDFFIPRVGGIYVSDKLSDRIKSQQLTGIKIVDVDGPFVECRSVS